MKAYTSIQAAIGRRKRALRWVSNLCLFGGAVALLVWCLVWAEARLFQDFAGRYFDSQANAAARLAPSGNAKPTQGKLTPVDQPIKIDSLIGKLAIDRLGISVVVLEGDGDRTLRIAAGHVPETALPGRAGNVVIAAHRDTFFRPLRNVRANDIITIATPGGTYRYLVESTSVVKPDRVDVMNPTPGPTMTLVTCFPFYYIGAAPLRFIVRAREIGPRDGAAPASERLG